MPATRLLAAVLRLTVTVAAAPPGASVPPLDEIFSQADVLASVQVNELVPTLVRTRSSDVIVNGPPNPPVEVNPVGGVMFRASGLANASISLCPAGVPQPVQRS